jgi:hypothetical protein
MVIRRRLHPIDHFLQTMPHLKGLGLIQKLSESLMVVAKDKSPQKLPIYGKRFYLPR